MAKFDQIFLWIITTLVTLQNLVKKHYFKCYLIWTNALCYEDQNKVIVEIAYLLHAQVLKGGIQTLVDWKN
jgi:hypothetical protein